MLRLASCWVWDFWFADDGERYHMFFLKASRALLAPVRRHLRATVGHAVSDDLVTWTECADALVPSDGPAFDDHATWTGSVLRGPDERWRMFYTGVDRASRGRIQRVGGAVSDDLLTWHRVSGEPLTVADRRWYESMADKAWPDEAWRDPWVFPDPEGEGWHMLVTARASHGPAADRGVVGHASSADLMSWRVEGPLSPAGAGFGQLEVLQTATVEGHAVLMFSCTTGELSPRRRARGDVGGIWVLNIDTTTGPFDMAGAYLLHDESLYAGRLIEDRSGRWVMMAFGNIGPDGGFGGEITDPIPVCWGADGRLHLTLPGD